MIDLDIDMINIISEKMRRPRESSRKQAYVIMLHEFSDEKISSFHAALSTFVNDETFYKENARQMKKNLTALIVDRDKNFTFRLHRDVMSLKSLNFRQIMKHSHTADFEKVIQTKITVLKNMII